MSPSCRLSLIRPVFGVHEPHRDVMVRRVIFVGDLPTIGVHLLSKSGSCCSIERRARSTYSSFHVKLLVSCGVSIRGEPGSRASRNTVVRLPPTSGSRSGDANVRERACAILCSASSTQERRSRTNSTIVCCGMRTGAVTSIAPYGGFTRKYMLRFFLRSTLTCSPSTLSTSRARVERSN